MNAVREYLNGKALAQRFGISTMTLHRWRFGYTAKGGKYHPPLEGFPTPYHFGGPDSFPLWKVSEIEAFEATQRAAA